MIYEVLFYLSKKIFLPEVESKQGMKGKAGRLPSSPAEHPQSLSGLK